MYNKLETVDVYINISLACAVSLVVLFCIAQHADVLNIKCVDLNVSLSLSLCFSSRDFPIQHNTEDIVCLDRKRLSTLLRLPSKRSTSRRSSCDVEAKKLGKHIIIPSSRQCPLAILNRPERSMKTLQIFSPTQSILMRISFCGLPQILNRRSKARDVISRQKYFSKSPLPT